MDRDRQPSDDRNNEGLHETAWPWSPSSQPEASARWHPAQGYLEVCGICQPVCPHAPVRTEARRTREGWMPMPEQVT